MLLKPLGICRGMGFLPSTHQTPAKADKNAVMAYCWPNNDTRSYLPVDLTGDLITGSGLFDKLRSAWPKYSTIIVPYSPIAAHRHAL